MFSKLQRDEKGFTIIEVLIVLAIAGLIMLIVFLAIPALQRNQRNNARNSDASRIAAAITECLANRNGSTGTTGNGCGVPGNIQYGTTSQLTSVTYSGSNPSGSTTAAQYSFGHRCDAEGASATTTGASQRDFVVMYQLEPSVVRCISS